MRGVVDESVDVGLDEPHIIDGDELQRWFRDNGAPEVTVLTRPALPQRNPEDEGADTETMSMEHILAGLQALPGVLELAPEPGSEHPEISWGDHFFYYAPDGQVPNNRQPYATIVTKNYPDDADSRLDAPDRWRVNIHVGSRAFTELIGYAPGDIDAVDVDYRTEDVFNPHPLYGAYGWVCVVNPGRSTLDRTLEALGGAHLDDRQRVERRNSRDEPAPDA